MQTETKSLLENQLNELIALYNGNNWLDESYCKKLSTIAEEEVSHIGANLV